MMPVQCEYQASGLFAHPFDCAKFLNCDRGRTFVTECRSGTVFNDQFKVCDWPRAVNCGLRQYAPFPVPVPGYDNGVPYMGEGSIDVRMDNQS